MKNDYYSYLKEKISIEEVCRQLGVQVLKNGSKSVTLCPFHNDTNPSLTLYEDQYHCFACGAHGDIFAIIKKIKNLDFYDSVNWLEKEFPYVLSHKPEEVALKKYSKKNAFDIAYDLFKEMSTEEDALLEKFSNKREYNKKFLIDSEIFYAKKNKLSRKYINDIEYRNILLEKYLIKEGTTNVLNANKQELQFTDAFKQDRTIITLRDYNNVIIGFAGRANQDEKPKYLFTKHLPKGDFLYRLNEVKNRCLKKINEDKKLDLYIVEGVFDALRLESLGLDAIAVLGSHITQTQVLVLEKFLNDISKDYKSVNIHIFLDSDDAGTNGTAKSIRNLWINETTRKNYIVVVVNKSVFKDRKEDNKIVNFKDPDEILNSIDEIDPKEWISNNQIEVFEFLMRYLYNPQNLVFDEDSFQFFYKEKLGVDQRISLLGKVIGIVSDRIWMAIIEIYSAFEFDCFEYDMCEAYLGFTQEKVGINPSVDTKSYRAAFQIAIEIAKNSCIKEDVPIDEFTWNRISCCADVFYDYFYNMLRKREHLKIPMLSIKIPKKFDEYRLKTLYPHEQLIMQQYVLNELLREDTYRKYELCIPAVRYNPNRECEIYTTGLDCYDFYNNSDSAAVSFAYQINMPVLNGDFRANEGMFRPFYDCWKNFIAFIRDGIDKISSNIIYKVKLDIRKYYESITNYSVRNTLMPMLIEALGTVENRFEFMCDNSKDISLKENNAKHIVEWIIEEMFDYKYYSSKDGEERSSDTALIGIPQGPNLSAYIANVILFKLDKAVAEYVDSVNKDNNKNNEYDNGEIVVRYARYVDDMVIVSSDPLYLNEIKSIIKNELSKLELELSPKTDDSEKTTKEEAYEWLVSEKGGLGVSSIFDFAEDSMESIVEEYSDYESLDRRNALKLLYNLTIDFNYIDDIEKNNIISSFFKTQDIRYYDIVRFSEMLIRHIIRSNADSDILDAYHQEWEKGSLYSSSNSMFKRQGIMVLAFLQGCINILKSKESSSMSIEEGEQRKKDKISIVNMFLTKDFIEICKDYTFDSEILQENQEVLKIKLLQLMNLVYDKSKEKDMKKIQTYVNGLNIKNEYVARWIYYTYENINSSNCFLFKEHYERENKTLYYFHYCISNMMIIQDKSAYDTIKSLILHFEGQFKLNPEDKFAKCMLIWFCNNTDYSITDGETALSILINTVTPKILSEIIDDNSVLKECIFVQEDDEEDTIYLPVPPGLEYPGIFAISKMVADKKVKRADFKKDAEVAGILVWEEYPKVDCQYDIKTAKLDDKYEELNEYLYKFKNTDRYILKIVEVYKQLFKYIKTNEDKDKLILSKYHIYSDDNEVIALTYKIADKILNSSVAVSQGRNSLIVKQVAESGSEYWQAGYILKDALEIDKIIIMYNNTDEDLTNQMLYYSFDRLIGDTINKNYINKGNKSYENSVNRTLEALKNFCNEKSNKKAFIIDCVMINNFISYRMNQNSYDYINGEVEYRISIWAKNYMSKSYKTIQDIFAQECNDTDSDSIPMRRVALAYYKIGLKLSWISAKYSNMDGFKLLAGGIFANSILINLLMQVSERINSLEENERLNFKNRDFPAELLEIDEEKMVLLTNCKNQVKTLKDISNNLLDRKYDNRINNITHIGWLLILCWLLEIDDLPNYIVTDRKKRYIDESMKAEILGLKKYFLSCDNVADKNSNQDSFPFDNIQGFMNIWTKENTEKMFMILDEVDKVDGIEVEIISSEFFKSSSSRDFVSIQLEGKSLNKEPKQFFTYGKLDSVNISHEKDINDETNFIWTQTVKNGKILGVSAIEDMLSNIAIYNGEKKKTKADKSLNKIIEIQEKPKIKASIEEKEKGNGESDKLEQDTIINKQSSNCKNELDDSANSDVVVDTVTCCAKNTQFNIKDFDNKIYKVQEHQNTSWKNRGENREKSFKNIDRIALFQFELDDSYQHPEVEICKHESLKCNEDERKKNSCAEFRRQKLLKSVMDACAKFSVEILLLPEYSVRPETVEYIKDYIIKQKYKFSVWAGTFRIVPNYILEESVFGQRLSNEDNYWSAVLPIINNKADNAYFKDKTAGEFDSVKVITERFKKYPAISLQELINPKPAKDEMFKPVMKRNFDKVIFGDARDDVTELICAEMFMMASPSNMNSFAKASFELYNRLNRTTVRLNDYNESINKDIKAFGDSTSIYQTEGKYGRTPIVLVPAYTTRATDYYVTGQAGYLASGLTTVFCNAVGEGTIGGSCFIGTDSWDAFRQDENKYMPDFSPYHGITPGIYQQFLKPKDRGGLGKSEQALLICDVNPNVSFKGRPNPESLGKSLELVAHLPIIEFSKPIEQSDAEKKPCTDKKCRCQKVEERKIFYSECIGCGNSKKCFRCDDVMKSIITVCDHINDGKEKFGFSTTIKDENSKDIQEAFNTLGEIIGSKWLKRRGDKYVEQHINNPQRWPDPTLIDWIFVNIDYNEYKENLTKIDVPKF